MRFMFWRNIRKGANQNLRELRVELLEIRTERRRVVGRENIEKKYSLFRSKFSNALLLLMFSIRFRLDNRMFVVPIHLGHNSSYTRN